MGAVGLTLFSGTLLAFIHFPFTSWNLTSLWESSFGRVDFLSAGPYYNWDQTITGLFWTLTIFTNQRHFGLGLAMGLFLFALALRPGSITRYAQEAPRSWLDWCLCHAGPCLQGDEDGRAHGWRAGNDPQPECRRGRRRERSPVAGRVGSRPQRLGRAGSRGGEGSWLM